MRHEFPRVSIVICSDGRAAALANTLSCLQHLDGPDFEVCVVQGPTEDGTTEVLAGWAGRIKMVRNAEIIREPSKKAAGTVQLGSHVKVKDEYGEENFTIVGPVEADPKKGLISLESPVGKALLGKTAGDKVKVSTPGGTSTLHVIFVS